MRVLMLTADYPPCSWSGIGTAVRRQAQALAELGAQVCVLVARPPGRDGVEPAKTPGVEVLALDRNRFPVRARDFDVLHLHSLPLTELAFELGRRFDLPLVATVHALVQEESEPSATLAFWVAVQARVLERSRRAVFLNRAERDAAEARWPALSTPMGRTVVIPGGLRTRSRAVSASPPAGPIVYAGRFAASKGLDLLAECLPAILERHPANVVLAGGHADAQGVRAVARIRESCGSRCTVRGWLEPEQLDDLFSTARLVLVPSRYEPCGQVALEAMSLGAPVLAAAVGGLAEMISSGSGGRLVDSRDPGDWVDAALALLQDDEARARLRRRGPVWVAKQYDIRVTARRLMEEAYAA